MTYVGFEFDFGVLGKLKCGGSPGIKVDFKLNCVFVLFNDFDQNVSSLEIDSNDWLKIKSD
jgi:hypothetical protein